MMRVRLSQYVVVRNLKGNTLICSGKSLENKSYRLDCSYRRLHYNRIGCRAIEKSHAVFKWLDQEEKRSVVFVGFGSECKLTKEQVYEIAYGLEISKQFPSSGYNFRNPIGPEKMPMHYRPVGWAPQREILSHPSIKGSLFHSGWGSVIETLQHGHCLVVLPFVIDQGLNARLLVEKGFAIEVSIEEDGSFSWDDVAKSHALAMVSKEGEVRNRAKQAGLVFGDKQISSSGVLGPVC